MSPLYIIHHAEINHNAYLCDYLDKRNIEYKKINGIKDDISILDTADLSGIIIIGGRYSVTEDHDWIRDEIKFIQRAIEKDIPLMGVCFGAQLISKALGAEVSTAENMEAGWHTIESDTSQLADRPNMDLDKSFEVFEWHEDTFTIPEGAIPIFNGRNIKNQGYLYGKILTMQFHLEMTERMISEWLTRYSQCMPEASQTVQSPEQMMERLDERLDNLHTVADKIYDWWLQMVKQ